MDFKDINWYPGHMKKAEDMIKENMRLVDAVIEVVDARIPISSRNPKIEELAGNKPVLLVLNKADLADRIKTEAWIGYFNMQGQRALAADSRLGKGVTDVKDALKDLSRQRGRPPRLMIAGIPNSGKSSLINRLTGRKSAKVGNKPGITRGKQWLKLPGSIMLLDTPGILMPKIKSDTSAFNLALCASIKEGIADSADLALELIGFLGRTYPNLLKKRYSLEYLSDLPLENMEKIAGNRGFIMAGKRIDYDRTANAVLDDFRSGKLGRITLEVPASEDWRETHGPD
jgi:ribosome biogenesis GTPase A